MKDTKNKEKIIVLAGNPNVGKSVFFNYLSKTYVDVSNYPGTTVEITSAHIEEDLILKDTPGVYGVGSFNDEEKVARDIILHADGIINIVSALSLERDLFLTKQLIDMGKELILVINQCDDADSINLQINTEKLQEHFNIPIYKTIAITGKGMKEVSDAIKNNLFKKGRTDPVLLSSLTEILPKVTNQAEALLILEGDLVIAERFNITPINQRNEIYNKRRSEINSIIEDSLITSNKKQRHLTKISNVLIHPIWGLFVAIFIAYLFLYQFLGVFIGGTLVEFTEGEIMNKYYEPAVKDFAARFFPVEITISNPNRIYTYAFSKGLKESDPYYSEIKNKASTLVGSKKEYYFGPKDYIENKDFKSMLPNSLYSALGTILVGQYGMLTLTVTYLLGLLLPLVIAFYAALSILEDTGYLPRLAVLLDGLLSRIGMNGRAIIPLILGLGCVTMASVTTRLLNTNREKIIAMAILGFAIPCSAQLGVIQSLLANNGGIKAWIIWLTVLSAVLVLTGYTMNKFLPGKATPLLIDLPPLRYPRLSNVFHKTKTKVVFFMTEAIPAFFIAALSVSLLQVCGLLEKIILFFEPICETLLKLPKEVAISFILGMVRRDFGAFGLTEINLTSSQVTIASVVLTLFVPCIATLAVMAKEQSWKLASSIWISSIILAISIGSILARIL